MDSQYGRDTSSCTLPLMSDLQLNEQAAICLR
jgi:hypothetical protein